MQFCEVNQFSSYSAVQALDFIAGFPATEGMLTYNPEEVEGNRQGLGRIRCIGYSIAHALSIPISPLIALVRIVAMPIFFGLLMMTNKSEGSPKLLKYLFVKWIGEVASVITSPLWHVAGIVRSALGIIAPHLYLKAPYVSQLSESQQNQAAAFYHQNLSPSARG